MTYEFTADAFSGNIPYWERIFPGLNPCRKILEIGSYEGRSAVWLIENVLNPRRGGELYCIDPWEPEAEEDPALWVAVEARFDRNVSLATRDDTTVVIKKRKGKSVFHLAKLISDGHADSFDCAYIDGNHQAAEVLTDLLLVFELVRNGGWIICDDYLWRVSDNPLHSPKMSIDAFGAAFFDKVTQERSDTNYQTLFVKRYGRPDKEWNREVMYYVYKATNERDRI